MEIKFKLILNSIVQGETPSYRAVVVHNGSVSENGLVQKVAEDCGLKPAVVKSVIELFFDQIVQELRNGMRVNLEQLDGGLAIRGTAGSSDASWGESDMKLVAYLNAKGNLKHPFTSTDPVNITDAVKVYLRRVLDEV